MVRVPVFSALFRPSAYEKPETREGGLTEAGRNGFVEETKGRTNFNAPGMASLSCVLRVNPMHLSALHFTTFLRRGRFVLWSGHVASLFPDARTQPLGSVDRRPLFPSSKRLEIIVKLKFLIPLLPLLISAQEITLEKIMSDPFWIGAIPDRVTIAEETNMIYFQVPRAIPLAREWKKLNPTDGSVSATGDEDRPYFTNAGSELNGSVRIYSIGGDLWISRSGQPRQPLISRGSRLTFVRFLDEDRFVFAEEENLHLFNLKSGASIQLTDLRLKKEPKEKELDYLANEERGLLQNIEEQYVREENRKQARKERRKMGALTKPGPTWLGKDLEHSDTPAISNDLRFVALVLEPTDRGKRSKFAQFINKEARVTERKARPKVGETTETSKLAILDRENNKLTWFDPAELPEIKTDRLASIKADLSEEDKKFLPKQKEDTPRKVRYAQHGFSADGKHLVVSVATSDYKDQWLLRVSSETGEWQLILHHYDEAWAPTFYPGVNTRNENDDTVWWSKDRSSVYFMSDKSGYQHLYRYDMAKEETVAVTSGKFEIYSPFEGPDSKFLYFHANRVHPGEYHFYRMPLQGGQWTQLTHEVGRHHVTLSEDGRLMVDRFETATTPPVLRIKKAHQKSWKTVYDGRSEAFKAIEWAKPEYVTYVNREGKNVHARLYKPENPNGAGVVFVHGAGYLQNAHKGWSTYFREYMFHNLLLREGYTILDPDYQASAGYGRDWRTAIYRHMGGKDLEDVVDGAHLLMEDHGVDRKRVGVYGGSYGGFIAFMAMFTTPDVFASGAALRPVSDWAHYNHWYTARILNTPKVDPVAYRRSSPIYFADGLKGKLLICHGMVDGNVQYQDVVRLSQRFIELGKKDWELASYPVEGHGFRTPSSWYDEYRRIHELFSETLK